ncbi:hypothetical protein UlMin_032853 [Ulmus minor]
MAAAAPASSHLLLHRLLHRPSQPPHSSPSPPFLFSFFLKPLLVTTFASNSPPKSALQLPNPSSTLFSSLSRLPSRSLLSRSLSFSRSVSLGSLSLSVEKEAEFEDEDGFEEEEEVENGDFDEEEAEEEEEIESGKLGLGENSRLGLHSLRLKNNGIKLPSLTVKEKKELASYAHSLGKKLKSQLVGKSGVTENVATSFVETLESNELLKIKIHRTCPGELDDVVKQLEELTGSVVVSNIGRTVILYRPSLTKLKAEEKKRENQKLFMRRKLKAKSTILARGTTRTPRFSGRGRRGSSRV